MGREILDGLLADKTVAAVHSLGRRESPLRHPKLTQHVVDFKALPALPSGISRVSEVYLALGTTIKVAGSQDAFRAIDFEANRAVARAALAGGATKCAAVSAMGASQTSGIFYNRVKGELEDALATMGFATLVIARPSFLAGDRAALGQPVRSGETLALRISEALRPLIPANFRSIRATDVAHALLSTLPVTVGHKVLLSAQMQTMAGR